MSRDDAQALFAEMVDRWPHIVPDEERDRWVHYLEQQPAAVARGAFEILRDSDDQRFMPQLSTYQDAAREVRRQHEAQPRSRQSYAEVAHNAITAIREGMGWAS